MVRGQSTSHTYDNLSRARGEEAREAAHIHTPDLTCKNLNEIKRCGITEARFPKAADVQGRHINLEREAVRYTNLELQANVS
ncbi:hypothetical protein PoB_005770300 [Plakobranchus ocellatus]|uniref:Uncharacterized protein n=1 Tax=Plakobranchus ocellatus TaxID=259542 RepID=A0AAV4CJD9_9GAST|nr:hypothetical protein PoB_005770300 [Plakobranchus ocellatus]